MKILGTLAVFALLAGAAPATLHAQSDLVFDTTRIQVMTAKRKYAMRVQLAVSGRQMARGLMFRKTLKPYDGMLFDFGGLTIARMWMKDTKIELDMLFIKADGTIESIGHGVPFSFLIIQSKGEVRAVLEIPHGTAKKLGIKPGDRIRHEIFGSPLKKLPSYKPKPHRKKRS